MPHKKNNSPFLEFTNYVQVQYVSARTIWALVLNIKCPLSATNM